MLPKNTIGISIDDADRSFLDVGWPAFKKLGFPVVLFVSTKTISPNSKNYLNWDEIRQLQDEGVVIGAHSHSHDHLAGLNIEQIKNDIEILDFDLLIDKLFVICVNSLLWGAKKLGTTYNAINIWIFVVIWPVITI